MMVTYNIGMVTLSEVDGCCNNKDKRNLSVTT